MNILYTTPTFPYAGKATTGFPNYLRKVTSFLKEMGHEPMILALGNEDGYREEGGVKIWTIKDVYPRISGDGLGVFARSCYRSYNINKKLNRLRREIPIDIVQFPSLDGMGLMFDGCIPSVYRLSSYTKTYYSTYQTLSKKEVAIRSYIERCSSRRFDTLISPAKITARAFGRDVKRRVKVIETPYVNDVDMPDTTFLDQKLKGKKYALFFGSMYYEKGVHIIAEVLERFLIDHPDYSFVFIGDLMLIHGENAGRLIRRKAGGCYDRVVISEPLKHDMLFPVIDNASFVVLPSIMDNLPNACIEAMSLGKLVIGTYGASFEQLIDHGSSGLLCRIGDSDSLLKQMEFAAFMNDRQRQMIGEKAHTRIEKLRPEVVVEKLIKLYRGVIFKKTGKIPV